MLNQTMGRRRPTIREIAADSCLAAVQREQQQPQQPSSQVASSPCWFLHDDAVEESSSRSHPHFLDACRMCGRCLPWDADIYMYMGDTPFCSEECREEQIEIDEARERIRRRRHAISAGKQGVKQTGAANPAAVVAVGAV